MANRWKEVWNRRQADLDKLSVNDEFCLYKELKRLDGFDVLIEDEYGYYKSFYDGILKVFDEKIKQYKSIFEVGCGSGANLVLFHNRGMDVGGIDYSKLLIEVAKKELPESDIGVEEAINLTVDEKYDVVISDSVFAYFQDVEYAKQVLHRMYEKTTNEIILLEIFDKDMEDECLAYRRSQMDDYDKQYEGLEKIFYPKQMFIDFANSHDCEIDFRPVVNDEYWNSRYMYNCFLTKKR